ncbi:hypothetical protein Tdes44962_MAKER02360 [Teratosphaeria destructans]|uniref:Uncharacterized protein n=1 Tax=Teratosphaeria destructans TaxID=418781 RepID=A0A9W7W318_9PEZI|nr:hypothetical protein Tdes44962_MAKER02360 [Teratosphaeria destructans]
MCWGQGRRGEGASMSSLETLKNSAVSGVPDLSALVAPWDLKPKRSRGPGLYASFSARGRRKVRSAAWAMWVAPVRRVAPWSVPARSR